jgi:hypothetical protein
MTSGQLEIELTVKQNRGNGLALYKMDVPLGQLDVFLNKRSLIRGLDYFYREGKIIITNKEYLNDPLRLKQNIHVRFAGFCKKDLSIMEEGDVGFIEHGTSGIYHPLGQCRAAYGRKDSLCDRKTARELVSLPVIYEWSVKDKECDC